MSASRPNFSRLEMKLTKVKDITILCCMHQFFKL